MEIRKYVNVHLYATSMDLTVHVTLRYTMCMSTLTCKHTQVHVYALHSSNLQENKYNIVLSVTGATKLMKKLDSRYKKDCHRKGNNLQQKLRVSGSPSKLPRPGSPQWPLNLVAVAGCSTESSQDDTSCSSSDSDS